jgi:hypothetical protein
VSTQNQKLIKSQQKMLRCLGMGQKFKRGTGRNKGTAHKRIIVPSHNAGGAKADKASQLAPAEPNQATSESTINITNESTINIANKLTTLPFMSSRPGKVVSFAVYLSKTISNSSSKNSTGTAKQARTSTNSTGNGTDTRKSMTHPTSNSTNDKSTTVEVEEESLMLPHGLDCATID